MPSEWVVLPVMGVEVVLKVAMVEDADIMLWLMAEAAEVHEALGRETWVGGVVQGNRLLNQI